MTIKYNVLEQDYISFNLYHSKHSQQGKKSLLFLRYGSPAIYWCTFVVILRFRFGYDLPLLYFIAAVVAIILIVSFPKRYRKRIEKTLRRHISEGKSNDFLGYQTFTLKDDCIEETSCSSTSYTKYSAVERIGYMDNCFFIYIGAVKAFIVPTSAFQNIEHRDAFIDMLTQKTGVHITEKY